jgi:hypothetical protein
MKADVKADLWDWMKVDCLVEPLVLKMAVRMAVHLDASKVVK